jgi:hypothetical protein
MATVKVINYRASVPTDGVVVDVTSRAAGWSRGVGAVEVVKIFCGDLWWKPLSRAHVLCYQRMELWMDVGDRTEYVKYLGFDQTHPSGRIFAL